MINVGKSTIQCMDFIGYISSYPSYMDTNSVPDWLCHTWSEHLEIQVTALGDNTCGVERRDVRSIGCCGAVLLLDWMLLIHPTEDTQHVINMLEEAWKNTSVHNNAVCFQVDGGGWNGSNILQQLGLNRALSVFTCNGGKAIQTLNRIQYTPEVQYISWTKKTLVIR